MFVAAVAAVKSNYASLMCLLAFVFTILPARADDVASDFFTTVRGIVITIVGFGILVGIAKMVKRK